MTAGRKANVRSGIATIGIMLASVFMLKAAESPTDHGSFANAASLYGMCTLTGEDGYPNPLAYGACLGYLSGLAEGMTSTFGVVKAVPYCMTAEGVNGAGMIAMFLKYYEAHKDEVIDGRKLAECSRCMAFMMFVEKFPCPPAVKS